MSKHLAFNSSTVRLGKLGGLACLCLLLAGCPSASNPPQPQSPSTPPPASPGSTSSSSKGTSGSASNSAPSSAEASQGDSQVSGTSGSAAGSDADFPGNEPGDQQGGESNGEIAGSTDGESAVSGDAEPGFGEVNGSESLPDLSDEPARAGGASSSAGQAGTDAAAGGEYNAGSFPGGQTGTGNPGSYGEPGSSGTSGRPGGTGQGPLTPAEQVAILDAQLEQGTGEFDAMILQTEAEQRRDTREQAPIKPSSSAGQATDSSGDSPYGGATASSGGYGGGIGGPSRGGVPQNTAKYPAPADIPSGNDDDVVARQLREAAMREPDPAVREKLWDEYRKYKGIE